MQPLEPRERRIVHRRYAPKTRTGCSTCKVRRVKCDEVKPFCNRCSSTGRKCDGYDTQTVSQKKSNPPSQTVRVSLTIDVSCDALEKRTFDFFRSRTVPCVAGYFQDNLWERVILQASHSEPAVRHALNALGSQHEERMLRHTAASNGSSQVANCRTDFPLQQYSKALTEVQQLLESGTASMDVILMCSLLFIHFEALRESFVPAIMHAESSIKLLHENTARKSGKIDPSIIHAMMRVDIQGAMYLGMRVPGLSFYTAATEDELPDRFVDLVQARDVVNTWTGRMFYFLRTEADDYKFRGADQLPLESIAQAQELEKTFLALDERLLAFMQQSDVRMTSREHHGLSMLLCRVKINRICSACCVYSEASMYDQFLDTFEEVLALCICIMTSEDADRRLFSVSLDEGLLQPLWFVATNCRDSHTRHRALALLRKLPAQKGVWHIEALTRDAEVCIEYEESWCEKQYPRCEDIPEWRRIHVTGFHGPDVLSPSTRFRARLHMLTRPNGMDGEWAQVDQMIDCKCRSIFGDSEQNVDTWKTTLPLPSYLYRTDPVGGNALGTSSGEHIEHWMAKMPFRFCNQAMASQYLQTIHVGVLTCNDIEYTCE